MIINTIDENNDEITISFYLSIDNIIIFDSKYRIFMEKIHNINIFIENYYYRDDILFVYSRQDDGIYIYISGNDYTYDINKIKMITSLDIINEKINNYKRMLRYITNNNNANKILKKINIMNAKKIKILDNSPNLDITYHVHKITSHYGFNKCKDIYCNMEWFCLFCKYYSKQLKHKCPFCKKLVVKHKK